MVLNAIKTILLKKGIYSLDDEARITFSQMGEDILLRKLFENRNKGFYIDVGAYHPKRYSNTFIFYLAGWRGINIDANPDSIAEFEKVRPRDINLSYAVSKHKKPLTYYMFSEPAVNSFSKKSINKYKNSPFSYTGERQVKTFPLKEILNKHMPKNTLIDFMSIDVEGLDLQVLESNDWKKYSPSVVVVEELQHPEHPLDESDLYSFLTKKGYMLISTAYHSLIFKRK